MNSKRRLRPVPALAAGLAAVMATVFIPVPSVAGPRSDRLDKEIRIMERAMDDMLVESPNFLVRSSEPTNGIHLEGRGVVFTFKTGLYSFPWRSDGDGWHWFRHNDDRIIVIDDEGAEIHSGKEWRQKQLPEEEKLYTAGKREIVDTILDFGQVLSALEGQDWLEVRARLRGAEYFHENDLSSLRVRVQMQDLRDYLDGRLDRDEVRARMQIEES